MFTWAIIKPILVKVWTWLKKYFWIPLVVIALAVGGFVAYGKVKNILALQKVTNSAYEQQIEVLRQGNEEEMRKRDELIWDYEKHIKEMEQEFDKKQQELIDAQKKQVKNYTKIYQKDPQKMAEIIESQFGVTYVP